MASFKFGSSAFNSPVGQRIEKVTDSSKASEDWALIIEICDIINETEEGPKDAIKAIKKRLGNTKNYKSILYTLTLTEACVKNCGKRFHLLVSNKDFLGDLTKILSPKGSGNRCPQVVQEKILSLIQSWRDAFRNAPDLQQIVTCYEHLKAQGFEFPAQDLDTLSPIYTPTRSVNEDVSAVPKPPSSEVSETDGKFLVRHRARTAPPGTQAPPAGPVQPTVESLGKLRSQLDIVEENVRVMSSMLIELSEVPPTSRNAEDLSLLKDINRTCRQMQERVVDLIGKIANEEVTGELLRINDELNNVFIRYDRFEKPHKEGADAQSVPPQQSSQSSFPQVAPASSNDVNNSLLIDFNEINPQIPADADVTRPPPPDDEFDMFAQSRSSTFTASRISGSTYDDNTNGVPVESSIASAMSAKGPYPKEAPEVAEAVKEDKSIDDDIEDVEEWLKDTNLTYLEQHAVAQAETAVATSQDASQVSSADFDKFLSERANVGSQRISSTRSSNAVPRQMEMMAGENRNDPYAL